MTNVRNYTEEQVYSEIKNYFDLEELVDEATFKKYGQRAWSFLCPRLLETILIIREGIGKPFYVNNWAITGPGETVYDERGLRVNLSDLVKAKTNKGKLYVTAHLMGKALDFKVKGMNSDDVRKWIVDNAHLLPYKVRLENKILSTGKTITWVHIDVYWEPQNPKVYLFNI